MKYNVVTAENLDSLCEKVNAHIVDGWIPQGGVCWTVEEDWDGYAQAMIFYTGE